MRKVSKFDAFFNFIKKIHLKYMTSFLPEVYMHLRHLENTNHTGVKDGPIFRCSDLNHLFRGALELIEHPDCRKWDEFESSWRHVAEETPCLIMDNRDGAQDHSMFHIAMDYIEMAMDLSKSQIQMIRRIQALDDSTFRRQTKEALDFLFLFRSPSTRDESNDKNKMEVAGQIMAQPFPGHLFGNRLGQFFSLFSGCVFLLKSSNFSVLTFAFAFYLGFIYCSQIHKEILVLPLLPKNL